MRRTLRVSWRQSRRLHHLAHGVRLAETGCVQALAYDREPDREGSDD